MKSYADERGHTSVSDIKEGDTVLLKQPRATKLSTTYNPKPYIVEKKKGSSLLLKRPDEPQITRNESMAHKIPSEQEATENAEHCVSERNDDANQEEMKSRPERQWKPPNYYGQN